MVKPRQAILAIFLVLTAICAVPVVAQDHELSFDAYLQLLIARARAEGVREETIYRMTAGLEPNARVIRLDRSQPGTPSRSGFPPLSSYLSRHVDEARIEAGREVFRSSPQTLARIEQQYGVPGEIVVAIFGHETAYGRVKGSFDLAQALATLAWEGRRRELFAGEFVNLLKVADKGFARNELVGSWAGAFDNPQFLPSVYLELAVDGDGDGRVDIFGNRADTFASIANYFRHSGWRAGQPWGVRASVPVGFDTEAVKTRLVAPLCPRVHERHSQWKTVTEWRALGIRPLQPLADDTLVTLFRPDGPGTRAWLLTSNYRVILEYNCSNYYAMSVGLLADEIAR